MGDEQSTFADFMLRTYKKGQMLLFQGEVPAFAYVLKKGIIKECDINKQGNEQITRLIHPMEIFPFAWVMDTTSVNHYYYETIIDSELYIIKKDEYHKLIASNHKFLLDELKRQAKKDRAQTKRLAAVLNYRAHNKLVNTLHYLVENFGVKAGTDSVLIDISLTHQEMANLTGLTRETITKELNKLIEDGVISKPSQQSQHSVRLSKLNELLDTPLSKPFY